MAPFVLATLLAYAVVELFYGVLVDSLLTMDRSGGEVAVVGNVKRKDVAELQKYTDYSIIYERNLFQSSAKGKAQEQSAEQDPFAGIEATKLELVLMGTVTGQDGSDRAIILKKRENKQEIFYQGDVIEGALIKRILRGRVILEYQGNDEILDMSEASSVRQQQFRATAQAAVSPAPVKKQVLRGPGTQAPKRRIISSGTQNRRLVPEEIPPPEEGLAEGEPEEYLEPEEYPEEGGPEEVINQDPEPVEPGAEEQNVNNQQIDAARTY